MTEKESREINNYKKLQDQIHRGSLYTKPTKRDPNAPAKTFGEEQFNKQYGTNRLADMDPFNGVETYSMRYAPKQRDLPKLSDQSFSKFLSLAPSARTNNMQTKNCFPRSYGLHSRVKKDKRSENISIESGRKRQRSLQAHPRPPQN
jgi:hypothetical protein